MFKQFSIALLFALLTSSAFAQNYAVDVEGIVCELCSYGVAKKLRKLDFIDPSQFEKGVKVDIENQTVYIAVRDNSILDREALFTTIESGGYNPVNVWAINEAGERSEISQ